MKNDFNVSVEYEDGAKVVSEILVPAKEDVKNFNKRQVLASYVKGVVVRIVTRHNKLKNNGYLQNLVGNQF